MMNYNEAEEMLVSLLKKRGTNKKFTIKSDDNQILEIDIQKGLVEYVFTDNTIFKSSMSRKEYNSNIISGSLMEQFIYIDRPEPKFKFELGREASCDLGDVNEFAPYQTMEESK